MKYTIKDFKKDFPTEDSCLDYIFNKKYPSIKGFYRVKGRKCYADAQGKQIHPLKGTIFEKSSTSLDLWFYAIFLFASSKNGVSAKEIQRQLGTTYKTAWRISHSIRKLMKQDKNPLEGVVEVDETYFGGKRRMKVKMGNKSAVFGMAERSGSVRAKKIPNRETHVILGNISQNIKRGSHIMADEFGVYSKVRGLGYYKSTIKHGKGHYVRGSIHTNTIEGFWSQLKRSIDGTHHAVSPKHLQKYIDQFVFQYNLRFSPIAVFEVLMNRI